MYGGNGTSTARVDHVVDAAPKFEAIQIAATLDHRRRLIERIEQHDAARLQRFADADLAQRATIALDPFDQQLGRAARILASVQPRANDTRVVQTRADRDGDNRSADRRSAGARQRRDCGSITIKRLSVRLGSGSARSDVQAARS